MGGTEHTAEAILFLLSQFVQDKVRMNVLLSSQSLKLKLAGVGAGCAGIHRQCLAQAAFADAEARSPK